MVEWAEPGDPIELERFSPIWTRLLDPLENLQNIDQIKPPLLLFRETAAFLFDRLLPSRTKHRSFDPE